MRCLTLLKSPTSSLCVRQAPGSGSGLSAPRPQCPTYLLLSSEKHFNTCLLFQFPIQFPILIENREDVIIGLQNFITLLKSLTDKLLVQNWFLLLANILIFLPPLLHTIRICFCSAVCLRTSILETGKRKPIFICQCHYKISMWERWMDNCPV